MTGCRFQAEGQRSQARRGPRFGICLKPATGHLPPSSIGTLPDWNSQPGTTPPFTHDCGGHSNDRMKHFILTTGSEQRADCVRIAYVLRHSNSSRQLCNRTTFPRCTTLAQRVLSASQWKEARNFEHAANRLSPSPGGVLRCFSLHHSRAVADWSVLARRSPLPRTSRSVSRPLPQSCR